MDLYNIKKANPSSLDRHGVTSADAASSSFLSLEVDLLQSRLDESERTLREVQKHNHFLRNIVETLQPTRDGHQKNPTATPQKINSSSTYSHTLHTQSSLTKLKHRSLDDCHAKYLLTVAELKYICQVYIIHYHYYSQPPPLHQDHNLLLATSLYKFITFPPPHGASRIISQNASRNRVKNTLVLRSWLPTDW